MNSLDGRESYCLMKYKLLSGKILEKESFSPHIIPKTKGLEESLTLLCAHFSAVSLCPFRKIKRVLKVYSFINLELNAIEMEVFKCKTF